MFVQVLLEISSNQKCKVSIFAFARSIATYHISSLGCPRVQSFAVPWWTQPMTSAVVVVVLSLTQAIGAIFPH